MKLTEQQIRKAKNLLNIPTNNQRNGNWLGILCQLHSDSNFGNASINLESGMMFCFSCHQKISIIDLAKQRFNVSFKEVMKMIDDCYEISFQSIPVQTKQKERKQSKVLREFEEVVFNPEHYYYIRQRGFTQEFCKEFNITRCLSGIYNDYMIIPIKDSAKGIEEFEARRLFEYEKLNMFFNTIEGNYHRLQRKFEKYIIKEKIKFKNYLLYKDDVLFYDDLIKYLLQPKVKYVPNSQAYRTLFNIDNLKFNETLYLVEGTGSLSKIWTFISKNCTCVFGSKIDIEQIELLKKFKHIVIIPDNDLAGYMMIKDLNKELTNFSVINIVTEDTDNSYVKDIQNTNEIAPSVYLSKYINRGISHGKAIF